jgi:hypothetical protein
MKHSLFFAAIFVVCTFAGCSGRPSELKNLSPVSITVVKDGQPLEDVEVMLFARQSSEVWACSGRTNSNGTAAMVSSVRESSAPGAKAGAYAVVLRKPPQLPPELKPALPGAAVSAQEAAAQQAKRTEFENKNRVVPKVLEAKETTPIELTVTEKTSATLTIDVAQY